MVNRLRFCGCAGSDYGDKTRIIIIIIITIVARCVVARVRVIVILYIIIITIIFGVFAEGWKVRDVTKSGSHRARWPERIIYYYYFIIQNARNNAYNYIHYNIIT